MRIAVGVDERDSSPTTLPPSSFLPATRNARKRSSDEFALDQSGFLVPKETANKGVPSSTRDKDDRHVKKHSSLALGSSVSTVTPRDRKRGSVRMSLGAPAKSGSTQLRTGSKHLRQQSAGSSSSIQMDQSRRIQLTSEANIPPSPSSSSHALSKHPSLSSTRQSSEKLSLGKEKEVHSSPSVAHSLLRGTQEGWSALDDDATAEALRKLDGISGKGARTRASIGSVSRASSHSRPSTPGTSRVHRSEGAEGSDRLSRRVSTVATGISSIRSREKLVEAAVGSDKETHQATSEINQFLDPGYQRLSTDQNLHNDEQSTASSSTNAEPKRTGTAGIRSSFTPKRGSASSTNYTGTPTSSYRDSASLSAATSMTSASVASGRFSLGKMRRNSASSDVSSVQSSDATSQRDRTAILAAESTDEQLVPPVPPLPKGLSYFKSPPQSTVSLTFASAEAIRNSPKDAESERPAPLPTTPSEGSTEVMNVNQTSDKEKDEKTSISSPVIKTPSKKWSFVNPLGLRRSLSPSNSGSLKSPTNLTPHSMNRTRQTQSPVSKDSKVLTPKSSIDNWQSIKKTAMASETSLASVSSLSSVPEYNRSLSLPQHARDASNQSTDLGEVSRSGTASSIGTSTAAAGLLDAQWSRASPTSKMQREPNNKRLTPSSIPFFRRSSSQSMHIPHPSNVTATPSSPTFSSIASVSSDTKDKPDGSLQSDSMMTSSSMLGFSQKKGSMLSLGLPSLLKGSNSRKSLHTDKSLLSAKDTDKGKQKDSESEKIKSRKDDKDRSESRISILMGRKRGKVSICTVYKL